MTRFRIALPLVVLALSPGAALATDSCLPDCSPTAGACNHFPFNPTWQNAAGEWRYQAVFTPQQLGGLRRVTDLSFASCSGSGTFRAQVFEVRMSHLPGPPTTSFAGNLPRPVVVRNPLPIVWGPVTDRWVSIRLDCPFDYNGIDNLTVELRYTGGTISGGFMGPTYDAGLAPRIYAYGPGAFGTVPSGALEGFAFKVRFTQADVTVAGGNPVPGGTVNLLADDSADAGLQYIAASSLGSGPFLIGCWPVELSVDVVLVLSLTNALPAVFVNYQSVLDFEGRATLVLNLPASQALVGLSLHTVFQVFSPVGSVFSRSGAFTIRP